MNEWKELKIDKCSEWPDDLFTNDDYEWETICEERGEPWNMSVGLKNANNFLAFKSGVRRYRCRLRQPEPTTHEEIMTPRFWEHNGSWHAIVEYHPEDDFNGFESYQLSGLSGKVSPEWFINRESAIIPPEATE